MALEEKSVLVIYLGSKKILKIVSNSQAKYLELLSDEFKHTFFSMGHPSTLTVTFQKFDTDWDDYIDLDSDVIIKNREKLTAVVSSVEKDKVLPLFIMLLIILALV